MASPAPATAPPTPARYSAARASGPPKDVTARPVKAHPLAGRPRGAGRAGQRQSPPAMRVRNVVTGRGQPQLPPAAAGHQAGATGRGRRRRGGAARAGCRVRLTEAVIFAAGRGDQPPLRAEAVAALAVGLARAGVAGEVVQRVTAVGHLLGAVRPGDRAQVSGLRTVGCGHACPWSSLEATPRRTPPSTWTCHAVRGPQVHGTSGRIGQERSRRSSVGLDHRRRG